MQLDVKGKVAPIAAVRLMTLDADAGGVARTFGSPLVGRVRERERLRADFADMTATSSCRLFTLIGPAGVGKSRLVADFLAGLGETATVARGRALSYGEGITYWPLVEALVAARRRAERGDRDVSRRHAACDPRPARARGCRAPARARARRPPLGRVTAARPRRARLRLVARSTDLPALHRAARAARRAAGLGGREAERHIGPARATGRPRHGRAGRRAARRGRARPGDAGADPGDGGGESALPRGDGRARAGDGRSRRGAADDPCAPPGTARHARRRGAHGDRARRRRGEGLPPRRRHRPCAGTRTRRRRGPAAVARAQGARPAGSDADPRRRCLSLQAPPDPRHGVRVVAEGGARGPARAFADWLDAHAACTSRTSSSATTSSRPPATGRSWTPTIPGRPRSPSGRGGASLPRVGRRSAGGTSTRPACCSSAPSRFSPTGRSGSGSCRTVSIR